MVAITHSAYPIPSYAEIKDPKVSLEPHEVSVDDAIVNPNGFVNSNILDGFKTPSKANEKRLVKYVIDEFSNFICNSQKDDSDTVVLLDKVQRKFANDEKSMQTFLHSFLSNEIDVLRGSFHTYADFATKHNTAYFYKTGFGDVNNDERKVYSVLKHFYLTNKQIVLIYDGQQRTTMILILFYEGFFGINEADTGANKKRLPYLDLASIFGYSDSREILRFKLHEKYLNADGVRGLNFYSETELKKHKADKLEKGKYANLICTQEFGKLGNYFINGELDSKLFIRHMVASYDLHLDTHTYVSFDRFVHYMYDLLFVNKGIHIIMDDHATAESNSEGYMLMNAHGIKASKEVVIESACNSVSNTQFGLEISDKISEQFRKHGFPVVDLTSRTMRLIISGLHKTRTVYIADKLKPTKKAKNAGNVLSIFGIGDGTTNNTQNEMINADSKLNAYTVFYMNQKDHFSDAIEQTNKFFFADKTTKYRPELNFVGSLDDHNKAAMIQLVFMSYFYASVDKSNFDPFTDRKQSYAMLRTMFGVKPILEVLSGEISSKTKNISNIARALIINQMKFTPENLAVILEYHGIGWKLIIPRVNKRDYTCVNKNTEDTKRLKNIFNIADSTTQIESNKNADHVHSDDLTSNTSALSDKIESVYSQQKVEVRGELKRLIRKFGDTLVVKMLLTDKVNKAKGSTDPSVFFDDNVAHRNTIRADYNMGLYSEAETIEVLKIRNILALMIIIQKTNIAEYAKINYLMLGSNDAQHPQEIITTQMAFDALIEGTEMKDDFPSLYNVIFNDTTNALHQSNLFSFVQ